MQSIQQQIFSKTQCCCLQAYVVADTCSESAALHTFLVHTQVLQLTSLLNFVVETVVELRSVAEEYSLKAAVVVDVVAASIFVAATYSFVQQKPEEIAWTCEAAVAVVAAVVVAAAAVVAAVAVDAETMTGQSVGAPFLQVVSFSWSEPVIPF